MSLNRVYLVGHVAKDGELNITQSGMKYYRFRLLTNEKWTNKNTGEKNERTEAHNCVVWGKMAEVLNDKITTGTKCIVEGSITYDKYDDKNGNKVVRTTIKCSHVEIGKGGKDAGTYQESYQG